MSCRDAARFGINHFLKAPRMERNAVKMLSSGCDVAAARVSSLGCVYSAKPVQIKPVQKFQHEGGRRPWSQTSRRGTTGS